MVIGQREDGVGLGKPGCGHDEVGGVDQRRQVCRLGDEIDAESRGGVTNVVARPVVGGDDGVAAAHERSGDGAVRNAEPDHQGRDRRGQEPVERGRVVHQAVIPRLMASA